jgi:hypothetical protein
MGSELRAGALLLGALLLVASPASATPSAAEREAAHKFMDEGVARMKASDPQHALENFSKAHELMHVPTTGVAVAKAHLALGHLVEARESAVEVVRTTKEPGEPAVFEKARKQAREIESQLKGRIPTVRIHVRGPNPTAVAVDGVEIPLALIAEPVPVNPGKRLITAKAADGTEGRVEVDVREGEKSDADVTLKEKSSAPEKASEKPATTPSTSTTPGEKPKVLGFGNDDTRGGGGGARRTPLAEGLIFGGFGAGAVGLGVGAITGFMTLNRASDIKQSCENNVCGPEAKSDLDSANTLGAISTIAVAVGIAGIGAGILGLAMPTSNAQKTGFRIQPTGSGVGGTF